MKDNNSDLGNIITTAHSCFQVSKKAEEKIFSRIAELTGKRRKKVHPLLLFKYVPSFSIIVFLVLLLPAVMITSYNVIIPRTVSIHPIILLSDSGVEGKNGTAYSSGYKLKKNDRIVTHESIFSDINLKRIATIRFFPETEAVLTNYSEFSNKIALTLNKGSLYINKDRKKKSKKQLIVQIQIYKFELAGTRVLFITEEKKIKAVCFEGIIKIYKKDAKGKDPFITLFSGEKIDLLLKDDSRNFLVSRVTLEEKRIDENNKDFPLYDLSDKKPEESKDKPEIQETIAAKDIGNEKSKEKDTIVNTTPIREKSFLSTIKKIAQLNDHETTAGVINFYSSCHDNKTAFIITRNKLFRIQDNNAIESTRFTTPVTFKIKPLLHDNTLILPEAHNIFFIDKESEEITTAIPLKEKEVLEDNYYPVIKDTLLYFPVKNSGYFTLDSMKPEKGLSLLYKEDFPLTPIIRENSTIIGSFYDNYIAAIDTASRILWKTDIPGESFCNFVMIDDNIYTYSDENDTHKIIEITTETGKRSNEWNIKKRVVSDIYTYNHIIVGVNTDGSLFSLDIQSNKVTSLPEIINSSISTRSWRNYYPLIVENMLYTGTEDGKLLVYDLENKSIEKELVINKDESFYTAPFIMDNSLYIVSNSGNLYQAF